MLAEARRYQQYQLFSPSDAIVLVDSTCESSSFSGGLQQCVLSCSFCENTLMLPYIFLIFSSC
jgi:hypothetical protein